MVGIKNILTDFNRKYFNLSIQRSPYCLSETHVSDLLVKRKKDKLILAVDDFSLHLHLFGTKIKTHFKN